MAIGAFNEITDTESNSRANASITVMESEREYIVDVEEASDLQTIVSTVLGTTSVTPGDGRMQRTPPLADPAFPYLYANAITDFHGVGQYTLTDAQADLEVPTVPQFALYDQYKVKVKFTTRPYPIVMDQDINFSNYTFYPRPNYDSGSLTLNPTPQPYQSAQEWNRYCTVENKPSLEFISAQQGQMAFQSTMTTSPTMVHNVVFPGKLKMPINTMTMKITCYACPYRYATSTSSYITGGYADTGGRNPWLGCVNQNPFQCQGINFPPGSLLYLGYETQVYTPPVYGEVQFSNGGLDSAQKLMNLSLTFLYTLRLATDVPGTSLASNNYISAFHNLLPWTLDRNFHFALSKPLNAQSGLPNSPTWLSAPLDLLLTDPDAPEQNVD